MIETPARSTVSTQRPGTPRALRRTTAVAGLVTLPLQLAGQALMQTGGTEPAFDAPASEIVAFFASTDPDLFRIGSYLTTLSLFTFLWFVGGVYSVTRPDWRAPIALVCGVTYIAGVGAGWELAVFRFADGVDSQIARLAFDLGNLSFATAWVSLGGFAVAMGWMALGADKPARLFGWWPIVAGICLITARAVWTTPLWLVGYALFWTWAIAWSIRLLSGRPIPGSSATRVADHERTLR